MKYFSMFSGIGGFELGIHRAVERAEIARDSDVTINMPDFESRNEEGRLRADCIGFSEIDKYAIKIYESHFGGHKNYGDANKIDPGTLPDFDLLVGGFPCQAFSIAGKRLGFDDTRGTLFFDIARILKVKRPRLCLLENVKGLLSHDSGRTFKTIVTTLAELGYAVEWQVLNSKNHGVPQNRERVFIVGHIGEFCGREVFPVGEGDGVPVQGVGTEPASGEHSTAITTNYRKGVHSGGETYALIKATQSLPDAQRVREIDGLATTLKGLGGGQGAKTGLYRTEGMRIRRLTPVECERLQGFPDGWTAGVSDSQRYKTLGNSVTVNVIEAIVSRMIQ